MVWLNGDPEARYTHNIKLPDSVPKPVPFDFKAAERKARWQGSESGGIQYLRHLCATLTDAQSDVIDAGAGDDRVMASWGSDRIKGGDGKDHIEGLAGDDIVEGDDRLDGDGLLKSGYLSSVPGASHGEDFMDGGAGNDTVTGGGGTDNLFGGIGNDKLWGDSGMESDSPFFLALQYHGDDYLDGEDGAHVTGNVFGMSQRKSENKLCHRKRHHGGCKLAYVIRAANIFEADNK